MSQIVVTRITKELIREVSGKDYSDFLLIHALDLHLKDAKEDESSEHVVSRRIKIIENLHLVPNLRFLNLSYNFISKIEGLERLGHLVELNLAENSLRDISGVEAVAHSLERLNLSGNRIERISPVLAQLAQLTTLRLSRNLLTDPKDLIHLVPLTQLKSLRFDENPLCTYEYPLEAELQSSLLSSPETPKEGLFLRLWSIFCIDSLDYVNGQLVTDTERELSRQVFASDQISRIRMTLSQKKHQHNAKKQELHGSEEKKIAMSPNPYQSYSQREVDAANQRLARFIRDIESLEAEITSLHQQLAKALQGVPSLKEYRTSSLQRPKEASSSTSSQRQRFSSQFSSNIPTKFRPENSQASGLPHDRTPAPPPPSLPTPPVASSPFPSAQAASVAASKVQELNKRVEVLTEKLLKSIQENKSLREEMRQQHQAYQPDEDAEREAEAMSWRRKYEEAQSTIERLEADLLDREVAHTHDREQLDVAKQQLLQEAERVHQLEQSLKEANEAAQASQQSAGPKLTSDLPCSETEAQTQMQNLNLRIEVDTLKSKLQEAQELQARTQKEIGHLKNLNSLLESQQKTQAQTQQWFPSKPLPVEEPSISLQRENEQLVRENKALLQRLKGLESMTHSNPVDPRSSAVGDGLLAWPSSAFSHDAQPQTKAKETLPEHSYFDMSSFDLPGLPPDGGSGGGKGDMSNPPSAQGPSEESKSPSRLVSHDQELHSQGHVPSLESLGPWDVSVAEILSYLLLEELKAQKFAGGDMDAQSAASNQKLRISLKEACIRAVVRMIGTSKQTAIFLPSHDPNQNPKKASSLPLSAFQNSEVLAGIVKRIHDGILRLEDAQYLQAEAKQLERIVQEKERQSAQVDKEIAEKDNVLKTLRLHSEEAKSQVTFALEELEQLTQRLREGRDEYRQTESEKQLVARELSILKQSLQETLKLHDLEQKSLSDLQTKARQLKAEQGAMETSLLQAKEELLGHESRLQTTKALASDQIAGFQKDLHALRAEMHSKQRTVSELAQQARGLEEEARRKKLAAEAALDALRREQQALQDALAGQQSTLRLLQAEVEHESNQRQQIERERQAAHEQRQHEAQRGDMRLQEKRQQLEALAQQETSLRQQLKEAREELRAMQNEQAALTLDVEQLRRQCDEGERQWTQRQQAAEEELQQSLTQSQAHQRSGRQLAAQLEQKKTEREALAGECRALEGKLADLKQQARQLELRGDEARDGLSGLEADKDKLRREVLGLKKDEESLRFQAQGLRAALEADKRALEETRKSLHHLSDEAAELREGNVQLRSQASQLQQSLDDAQAELNEARHASERERRQLTELRTKKSLAEADRQRLEEERCFVKEQLQELQNRRAEYEMQLQQAQEQLRQMQKRMSAMEKQQLETQQLEDEALEQHTLRKAQQKALQAEVEELQAQRAQERRLLDKFKEDKSGLQGEVLRVNNELQMLQRQVQQKEAAHEALQRELDALRRGEKDATEELQRLRDSERLAVRRMEDLEIHYKDIQQQLKTLREQLAQEENHYHQARKDSAEEEGKLAQQQRVMQQALGDLARIEADIAEANRLMYLERQKAFEEISHLRLAKQSAQTQMFLLSEAEKKNQVRTTSDIGSKTSVPYNKSGLQLPSTFQSTRRPPGASLVPSSSASHVLSDPLDSLPETLRPREPKGYEAQYFQKLPPVGSIIPPPNVPGSDEAQEAKEGSAWPISEARPNVPLSSLQQEVQKLRLQTQSVLTSNPHTSSKDPL